MRFRREAGRILFAGGHGRRSRQRFDPQPAHQMQPEERGVQERIGLRMWPKLLSYRRVYDLQEQLQLLLHYRSGLRRRDQKQHATPDKMRQDEPQLRYLCVQIGSTSATACHSSVCAVWARARIGSAAAAGILVQPARNRDGPESAAAETGLSSSNRALQRTITPRCAGSLWRLPLNANVRLFVESPSLARRGGSLRRAASTSLAWGDEDPVRDVDLPPDRQRRRERGGSRSRQRLP